MTAVGISVPQTGLMATAALGTSHEVARPTAA